MTPALQMAFLLTVLAGLSTGIGSAIAFFFRHTNTRFLSLMLGVSAGVMLYVSFVEMFQQSRQSLMLVLGPRPGYALAVFAFFIGIAIIAVIDLLVPSGENPHERLENDDLAPAAPAHGPAADKKLLRMGLFSALAIAIHNFPEGFAVFTSALKDPKIGGAIAFAIALHNIPEGIAISVPIYYATKNRLKAFSLSFLSGLAEPLGALIGFVLLFRYLNNPIIFGCVLSVTAGIMVYLSLDELLPAAEKYGEHHLVTIGVISGLAIMALSLLFLT